MLGVSSKEDVTDFKRSVGVKESVKWGENNKWALLNDVLGVCCQEKKLRPTKNTDQDHQQDSIIIGEVKSFTLNCEKILKVIVYTYRYWHKDIDKLKKKA